MMERPEMTKATFLAKSKWNGGSFLNEYGFLTRR